MKIVIYIRDAEKNNAIIHYVDIISSEISNNSNYQVEFINYIRVINPNDIVLVISLQSYFRLLLKNPNQKIIFWFQGITPEEVATSYSGLYSKLKVPVFSILEKIVLIKSKFNFFVSNSMLNHYQTKYKYNKDNYMIMPCFNKAIAQNSFYYKHKYESASFVYAGAVIKWQCLDETIHLFSLLKEKLKNATLTILTSNQQEVIPIIKKYNISAIIKYVPLEELDKELAKYKYGFILRKDLKMNHVATPTKLNSYLANGVIPIYSDVIDDFNNLFINKYFYIKINIDNLTEAVEDICIFEKKKIIVKDIFNEYSDIFNKYYNETEYRIKIRNAINHFFPL